MKKVVKLLFSLGLCLIMASCVFEEKAKIFLSAQPINKNNSIFVDEKPIFRIRQRIYFVLISKEEIENPKLKLQVLKLDKKAPFHGIKSALGIDINRGLHKQVVKDYFVVHKAGSYVIRVFSYDNLDNPIAQEYFWVEEL